ncbi:hypothetical protein CLU79DRAFT_849986 [Phycomyces nitens]|nr:hypothetical protein CLU79DRAFT_849986 [Phycomyces nitens]
MVLANGRPLSALVVLLSPKDLQCLCACIGPWVNQVCLIVSAAGSFVPVGSPAVPVGAFVPAGGSVGIGIGIFCPASRMTELEEGYRPTAEPIPKSGIQIMGKVLQSSRFQRVESKPWVDSHNQGKTHCRADSKKWNPDHGQSPTVKVTDPNNCMPTKYNAKFNAKSSAMFAVKSNVWLKCIPKHGSVSSLEAKFNVESDF